MYLCAALVAQEMDWLDKLEKRLRKSPKSAADAEEISEELDVSWNIHFKSTHVIKWTWYNSVYNTIYISYKFVIYHSGYTIL